MTDELHPYELLFLSCLRVTPCSAFPHTRRPIHGPGDVVVNVRQLVEAEAVALTARESLAAAAQHMASEPEQLLSRLVSHFMRLFDCPSLDGVIPAVNRLYVTLNEQRNFTRSLAAALDLSTDAGTLPLYLYGPQLSSCYCIDWGL